ncbi:MAG TPA: formate dehydrogenase, partial [Syntrophomonas sp.]|nr:formate dehydrogenase [Syntrophomonas sp.]
PKLTPADIKTEVFFLPAAAVYEKEGTAASTSRWVQYRWKGAEPVGESKSDLWIYNELAKKIKKVYAGSKRVEDEPIVNMTWEVENEHGHDDPVVVAKELCGYSVADGKPVEGFA